MVKMQTLAPLKPQPKPTSESHQMATIHIPKSMLTAPFLQHPSLTAGQKRYLYSIANVYSTRHMRALMKQQYLDVLHRCIRAGQCSLRENKNTGSNTCVKKKRSDGESRKNSTATMRQAGNGDRHGTAGGSGRTSLPRIGSQNRTVSSISTSKDRDGRKRKTNDYTEGNATGKGTDVSETQKTNEEEFLNENMSSLSVEGNEELLMEV
uniref:Protein FAM216A-like n=2 Tax=Scleropages formosus TaxID=113540 RepID=A0A8C9RDQ6_SCLFO